VSVENSGQSREILQSYLQQLVDRGDYAQFFSDDVTISVNGGVAASGSAATEQFIRFLHEQAFDAYPEIGLQTFGDGSAGVEFVFAGKHTGEFLGVPATGNSVRVPYSAFYDVAGEKISAIRAYMPMDQLIGQARGASDA
jgi:predicted ester cyclase